MNPSHITTVSQQTSGLSRSGIVGNHGAGQFSMGASTQLPAFTSGRFRTKVDGGMGDDERSVTQESNYFSSHQMVLATSDVEPDNAELETDFGSTEKFETMVGDLRRTFLGWLKMTSSSLRDEREGLKNRIRSFNEQKQRIMNNLQAEKKLEQDRLREDRRKFEAEVASQMRQIQIEREETLRKVNESKAKFESEVEVIRRKFAMERKKFEQECEAFDNERQTVVDNNIATETMVDINVGGVVFETSRHTVLQQTGSLLEGILSGRYQISRDKQGCIFFDRDAEKFRVILNFLRNQSNPPIPRDSEESFALLKEAEFYGIKFFPFPLVFALGGHSGVEHLRAVEVLDITQQQWRPCKAMTTERAYFGATSIRGSLQVFGGQNLDYKALCDMEVYDCLRDQWMNGPSLNISRRNNCAGVLGERLYTMGGFDGSSVLSSVECYDYRMRNWMEIAPLTVPRSAAMSCVRDDKLYVIGGTTGNRVRTVEVYEPRINKWEELPATLLEIRSSGAAVSYHSSFIFVMGGTDNARNILETCELYDGDKWNYGKSMTEGRMDFAASLVSDSFLISGGQNSDVLNSTDFFRPDEDEWQSGPPMLFPRYGHCLLVAAI